MMKRPDIARKLFHQYTSKILFEPINRKIYRTNLMCNGNLTRIILHCRFFTHSARSFSSSDKLPESKVVQTENLNPDVKIIQPGLLPKDPAGSVPPADKSTAKAVIQETQAEAVERITIQKDVIIVEPVKSKPELKVEPPPPPTPPEGEKKEKKTAKSIIQEAVEKVTKKRIRVDLTASSVERNFITPVRAMSDFLLKPSDLENLRATKRRSPYENEPPITVFWRKDVEARAIEVWGSKENLTKELLKRDLERRFYQQNTFTTKRKLRDYRREKDHQREQKMVETAGLFGPSGKVVLTAVAINGSNFLFKLFAWIFTGSHSMFSECIHSLADTINQLILAYGIHKSVQRADSDHPYGYTNMRYVSSLISGVGIFCVGTGLSLYHGVTGLLNPSDIENFYWYIILLVTLLLAKRKKLQRSLAHFFPD